MPACSGDESDGTRCTSGDYGGTGTNRMRKSVYQFIRPRRSIKHELQQVHQRSASCVTSSNNSQTNRAEPVGGGKQGVAATSAPPRESTSIWQKASQLRQSFRKNSGHSKSSKSDHQKGALLGLNSSTQQKSPDAGHKSSKSDHRRAWGSQRELRCKRESMRNAQFRGTSTDGDTSPSFESRHVRSLSDYESRNVRDSGGLEPALFSSNSTLNDEVFLLPHQSRNPRSPRKLTKDSGYETSAQGEPDYVNADWFSDNSTSHRKSESLCSLTMDVGHPQKGVLPAVQRRLSSGYHSGGHAQIPPRAVQNVPSDDHCREGSRMSVSSVSSGWEPSGKLYRSQSYISDLMPERPRRDLDVHHTRTHSTNDQSSYQYPRFSYSKSDSLDFRQQGFRHINSRYSSNESLSSWSGSTHGVSNARSTPTLPQAVEEEHIVPGSVHYPCQSKPNSFYPALSVPNLEQEDMVTRRFKKGSVYEALATKSGFDFAPVIQSRQPYWDKMDNPPETANNPNSVYKTSEGPRSPRHKSFAESRNQEESYETAPDCEYVSEESLVTKRSRDFKSNGTVQSFESSNGHGCNTSKFGHVSSKEEDRNSPTPPPPPVRDSSIGKYKEGSHEKYPSWPVTSSAMPSSFSASTNNCRSHSWTEQTDYPKERLMYSRPKKGYKISTHQLQPVLERSSESRRNGSGSSNDSTCTLTPKDYCSDLDSSLQKALEPMSSNDIDFDKLYNSSYTPRCYGDRNFNIPSPPERDVPPPPKNPFKDCPNQGENYLNKYNDFLQQFERNPEPRSFDNNKHWEVPEPKRYTEAYDDITTPFLDRLRKDSESMPNVWPATLANDTETGSESGTCIDSVGSSTSSQETLKWHGSYSDLSSLSFQVSNRSSLFDSGISTMPDSGRLSPQSSCDGSASVMTEGSTRAQVVARHGYQKENIVRSARVQPPKRHDSESVLYYLSEARQQKRAQKGYVAAEKEHNQERKNYPGELHSNHFSDKEQGSYNVNEAAKNQRLSTGSNEPQRHNKAEPQKPSRMSMSESEEGYQRQLFLDPEKKHRVSDPELKAFQKQAVLSFYHRQTGHGDSGHPSPSSPTSPAFPDVVQPANGNKASSPTRPSPPKWNDYERHQSEGGAKYSENICSYSWSVTSVPYNNSSVMVASAVKMEPSAHPSQQPRRSVPPPPPPVDPISSLPEKLHPANGAEVRRMSAFHPSRDEIIPWESLSEYQSKTPDNNNQTGHALPPGMKNGMVHDGMLVSNAANYFRSNKSARKAQLKEVRHSNGDTSTVKVITPDGVTVLEKKDHPRGDCFPGEKPPQLPPKRINKPPAPPPPPNPPSRPPAPLPPPSPPPTPAQKVVGSLNCNGINSSAEERQIAGLKRLSVEDDEELKRIHEESSRLAAGRTRHPEGGVNHVAQTHQQHNHSAGRVLSTSASSPSLLPPASSSSSTVRGGCPVASACSSPDLPLPPPPSNSGGEVLASDEPLPPPPDLNDMDKNGRNQMASLVYPKNSYMSYRSERKLSRQGFDGKYRRVSPTSPPPTTTKHLEYGDDGGGEMSPSSSWELVHIRKHAPTVIFHSESMPVKSIAHLPNGHRNSVCLAVSPQELLEVERDAKITIEENEKNANMSMAVMVEGPAPTGFDRVSPASVDPVSSQAERVSQSPSSPVSETASNYRGHSTVECPLSERRLSPLNDNVSPAGPGSVSSHGNSPASSPVAVISRKSLSPVSDSNSSSSESSGTAVPRINCATQTTGTPSLTRKQVRKTREELDCDRLSQDFAAYCKDAMLKRLLAPTPEHKTMSDYMEGLFSLDFKRNGQQNYRRSILAKDALNNTIAASNGVNRDVSNLPANSAYFTTSEPKAKLLNRYGQDINRQDWTNERELDKKKEDLIASISKKLELLRLEQVAIQEEVAQNEILGKDVASRVEQLTKPNELQKYRLHVEEMEKIINLLMSLSGRLARAQNALMCLPPEISDDERRLLEAKRDKLCAQHEEARHLKESIDRRSQQVSGFLHCYLSGEEYADYEHFVKMKSKLLMDARELDEKIKLGEEQLSALENGGTTNIWHRTHSRTGSTSV